MARQRYDNCFGTLGAGQAAGDTTIALAAALTYADGIQVPTLSGNTIDITVEPNSANFEVERITAYTQGALTATVTRGISGSAKAHAPGVTFGHNPTAVGDFNGGTPNLTLGLTNTAGTSGVPFDAASAVAVFDTTAPVTQAYSDVAATGSAAVAARRDHKHGMPAASGGVTWPLTNTGDETFQPNSVANNTLTLHNAASAVAGLTLSGQAINGSTGEVDMGVSTSATFGTLHINVNGAVIMQAGDLNAVAFRLHGTGTAQGPAISSTANSLTIGGDISGNTGIVITVTAGGTSANQFQFQSQSAGSSPTASVIGSDANIDYTISPKGSGLINIGYATTALGGGATPTFGTIGGSGPANAAQLCWVAFKVNGTTTFFPGWR